MGQRLNIEIKKKGKEKTIANCYYHWSAYTESSLLLAKEILENIINYHDEKDDFKKALQLLQSTGAGIIHNEYDILKKKQKRYCRVGEDRNMGLISFTDKGIEETRTWEEGRIEIELDDDDYKDLEHFRVYSTINFGVYWHEDISFIKEDYEEEIKEGKLNLDNITELDLDLDYMTLEDINLFLSKINEIENNYGAFKIKGNEEEIYFMIY